MGSIAPARLRSTSLSDSYASRSWSNSLGECRQKPIADIRERSARFSVANKRGDGSAIREKLSLSAFPGSRFGKGCNSAVKHLREILNRPRYKKMIRTDHAVIDWNHEELVSAFPI
jgi:hypothetical protein